MKEKKYYSQVAYLVKAILVIIVIGVTFFIITQFSDKIAQEISIKLRKNLVVIEYIMNGIFGIIAFGSIALILLRGKPRVTLSDTTLRTNRFKKDFIELKTYHPSKGGSEPYVISHDGKQYDIELSWFSKKDQKEIEAFIKERVATA
ncbi:hypothetical protein H2O64_07360 [Kordia sp. YSTF-M3]|uniref:Uncharacterized protein n=1 Tax=Kordia aestuariivivens TaxID=2759037 RepID=A0ABR7Q7F6_9FLAO|nr:hypothetical protein [Kordia aestuariivivens]MBC8754485.1 hypothetical protein [Kordia aestuariivivens]